MPVVEKFVSINGEGRCAGKLAAFIRFAGCNLRCSYCDTMWANEPGAAVQSETVAALVAWVRETGVECVTLTGGEPVLQPHLAQLVRVLCGEAGPTGHGLRVEVETNGAADLAELANLRQQLRGVAPGALTFTVDWKLPSSGMEAHMLPTNFVLLDARDAVKFVCAESDLPRVLEVARQLDLPGRVPVYLSPCFGRIEPARIVEFMQENGMIWATAQLQLHRIESGLTLRGACSRHERIQQSVPVVGAGRGCGSRRRLWNGSCRRKVAQRYGRVRYCGE